MRYGDSASNSMPPAGEVRHGVRRTAPPEYALHNRLGYVFGKPISQAAAHTPRRINQIRHFLLQYDRVLKEQAAGRAIIVYMDESYCHQNHYRGLCWHKKNGTVIRPRGKGQRIIILHAVTKDGPLINDGELVYVDEFDSDEHPKAEMIFTAKKAQGDYHDTMDGDMFMLWIDNRLRPAFEATYGTDMKMILVLDNAPCHHGKADGSFFAADHNKGQLVEFLKKRGVKEIEVEMTTDTVNEQAPDTVPTWRSPSINFVGWYFLDTDVNACFQVTRCDAHPRKGNILWVEKQMIRRANKSASDFYLCDKKYAAKKKYGTFQSYVESGELKLIVHILLPATG